MTLVMQRRPHGQNVEGNAYPDDRIERGVEMHIARGKHQEQVIHGQRVLWGLHGHRSQQTVEQSGQLAAKLLEQVFNFLQTYADAR